MFHHLFLNTVVKDAINRKWLVIFCWIGTHLTHTWETKSQKGEGGVSGIPQFIITFPINNAGTLDDSET